MDQLISVAELAERQDERGLVILDCSIEARDDEHGATQYRSGEALFGDHHIAGAQHVDLVHAISDPQSRLLFAMPDPEVFCSVMARLGVHDGATVVLYDRSFTAWAARVWWMLRWIGFDNALLLDGGLRAWQAAGQPVTQEVHQREAGTLSMSLRPEVIAETPEIRDAVDAPEVCLIDTLPAESFAGQWDDYARPGHIAGASNVSALSMFEENGCFKPKADLQTMYDGAGGSRHVTYCGAGILAAATAFVMVQLGYEDVALYSASLQEWAADPSNPMGVTSI